MLSNNDAEALATQLEALAAQVRNTKGPVGPVSFTIKREDHDPMDVSSALGDGPMTHDFKYMGHRIEIAIEWVPRLPAGQG